MLSIYDLFENQAKLNADNPALIIDDQVFSYGNICSQVNALSESFHNAGIRKGSIVAMLFGNSLSFVTIFYALEKLGAIPALLNYRLLPEELLILINQSKCDYIIYSAEYRNSILPIKKKLPEKTVFISDDEAEAHDLGAMILSGNPEWEYKAEVNADDIALYLYTGGTLALSKIAVASHEALFLRLATRAIAGSVDYRVGDNYLLFNPLFHQGGISQLMFMLSSGGCITLLKKLDVEQIIYSIQKYRVTRMLLLPPSLCRRLKENLEFLKHDRSSVKTVTLTGGCSSAEIINDVFDLFPNAKIAIGYGHTEDAANTSHSFTREMYRQNPKLSLSVGKRNPACRLKLIDENGYEVPDGEGGQCIAKSPFMMSGYLGKTNTFDEQGWFHTGDILSRDEEGFYYFRGRTNDMIKTGGENVMAAEVEDIIILNPEIEKASVFGLSGGDLGEYIVAAVVKTEDSEISESELQNFISLKLAKYKVPKRIFFLKDLPVTTIGKIDKNALRKSYSELFRLEGKRGY